MIALAIVVLVALASRWGNDMMERFGRQEHSQAQLAQIQQEMLVLQHQMQEQNPAALLEEAALAASPESPEGLAKSKVDYGLQSARADGAASKYLHDADTVNALELMNEATLDALSQQVKELQLENQQLKNQLSFYENLLPAEGKAGLSIRGFNAQRQAGNELVWQILLMQLKRDASGFKGELEWQVSGTLDGKAWRLPANERRQSIELEAYQRLEGRLRIPERLQLSSLTVVVWEGKQERARQSIAFDTDTEADAQISP